MPIATTLLRVLYLRTLALLAQQHSFGVLVDDWSIHWRTSNPHGRGLRKVVDALKDTLKSLVRFCLLQRKVCTETAAISSTV